MTIRPTKQLLSLSSVLVGLLFSGLVLALATDREQPIQIEADAAELDDASGRTVYTGNVIVTQGSMRLTGNRLTIFYNEDNTLKTATMLGQPATFKQMPDNPEQGQIDGKGIKIDYLAMQDRLVLTEDAELTQNGKMFRAYNIEYDTKKAKMLARKANTGEATPSGKEAGSNTGRIKVILPPPKK